MGEGQFTLRSQMRGAEEGFKNEAKFRFCVVGERPEGIWKTNPILREADFTLRSRLGETVAVGRRFGQGAGSRFGI